MNIKKNILRFVSFFLLGFLITSCDSKDANDCIQASGKTIREERNITPFSRILVNEEVSVVIKQDSIYKVEVQSGENLLNDIKVEVVNDQLILTNNNICNFFREYNNTTIYITAPNLTEIRSATQRDIRSDGILKVDNLALLSENYLNNEYLTSANFYLEVEAESLRMVFNGISNVFINGKAKNLNINMASGNGRFEGRNFLVENANIYHRGSNDLIVNASTSLKGDIFSTGNVILVGQPETVEVTEHYKGKLIIEE
ncbi:head GIN domain-containing protein [Galbibacter mesophilus]|uniref:head GIN domain-containing protein n=1 Tax=Galbibacter mesophilus TaxID=379069 RepID=UPI001A90D4DF|nr:head GIN domain-containing protein [Galbibacter mesophilus]MCM5661495.1 DUF2807 domain-containing protein [Galbibacter mesophilus]